MKQNRFQSHPAAAHQTVTEAIKLNTGSKIIRILPTPQKLSAHAGQATFFGFLALRKVRALVAGLWPHRPTSPNATKPVEIARGFLACTLDLPRHQRRRLIRAASGFHYDPWLALLEAKGLRSIVVADLNRRLQSFIKKETPWEPTPMGCPGCAAKSSSPPRRRSRSACSPTTSPCSSPGTSAGWSG